MIITSLVNIGFAKDLSEYKEEAEKCKQGMHDSCRVLAKKFISVGDQKRGIALLKRSCKAKDAASCKELADIHVVKLQAKEATAIYKEQCAKGDKKSCQHMALLKTPQKMIDKKTAECEQGQIKTCRLIGFFFLRKGELEKATKYLSKGCDNQDADSCELIGSIYLKDNKLSLAQPPLKKACELKKAQSCKMLGAAYIKESKIKADLGMKYIQEGCKLSNGPECKKLNSSPSK